MSYMHNKEDKNTTRYYPKNREKCDKSYYIARSSWEYKLFQWCDTNSNILKWSSEPVGIPYQDPITGKDRRYFPDVLIKCRTKNDKEKIFLVEIKPSKDLKVSDKSKGKSKKTILHEQKTFLTNKAKIKAARRYCKLKGWTFKIITEKELFNQRNN